MISLLEEKNNISERIIDKVIELLDNQKFQLALKIAGSLLALKYIYNIYRKRADQRKYLGVGKQKNKTIDWDDIIQNLSDQDISFSKK